MSKKEVEKLLKETIKKAEYTESTILDLKDCLTKEYVTEDCKKHIREEIKKNTERYIYYKDIEKALTYLIMVL